MKHDGGWIYVLLLSVLPRSGRCVRLGSRTGG